MKALAVNPEIGQRGDFRKFTLTLPKSIWEKLTRESMRRKTHNQPNHMLSEVAREWLLAGSANAGNHQPKTSAEESAKIK